MALLLLLAPAVGCGDTKSEEAADEVEQSSMDERVERSADDFPSELVDPEEYRAGADLIRQHYTAISRGSYRRAFDLWEEGSREFNEFTAEAEKISRAVVTFGESGLIGEQNGQVTIEVPVTVEVTGPGGAIEYRGESFLLRKQKDGTWRIVANRSDQQL